MSTPADVFWMDLRAKPGRSLLDKFNGLLRRAGLEELDFNKKMTAIKIHFGEPGNLATIRPNYVAQVVAAVQKKGGKAFLTDSNTIYYGKRDNAVDHLASASMNGYHRIATGCDVIIADGLRGTDQVEIEINQKHCKTAKIGSAIAHADVIIAMSHFKGHEITGFGGAIKNIGMGSASRSGKYEMHSSSKPHIVLDKCTGCQFCIKNCAQEAIHLNEDRKAVINYERCVGCGQCVAVCRYNAAQIEYNEVASICCEKIAEYSLGTLKDKQAFYINFLMDVSPDCDCWNVNDYPLIPNIGILASTDPVAIDRASVDLANQSIPQKQSKLAESDYKPSDDIFTAVHPKTNWHAMLDHAEEIGLGTQQYQLIQIN